MEWRFGSDRHGADIPGDGGHCAGIEALLSLYSDGMTSAAESRRVEDHLEECESCRQAHFWMRATYEVLSHRPAALPPPNMSSRIRVAIAEADAKDRRAARLRFLTRPAYAFAACAALAAIGFASFSILSHGPRTASSESTPARPSTVETTIRPGRGTTLAPVSRAIRPVLIHEAARPSAETLRQPVSPVDLNRYPVAPAPVRSANGGQVLTSYRSATASTSESNLAAPRRETGFVTHISRVARLPEVRLQHTGNATGPAILHLPDDRVAAVAPSPEPPAASPGPEAPPTAASPFPEAHATVPAESRVAEAPSTTGLTAVSTTSTPRAGVLGDVSAHVREKWQVASAVYVSSARFDAAQHSASCTVPIVGPISY